MTEARHFVLPHETILAFGMAGPLFTGLFKLFLAVGLIVANLFTVLAEFREMSSGVCGPKSHCVINNTLTKSLKVWVGELFLVWIDPDWTLEPLTFTSTSSSSFGATSGSSFVATFLCWIERLSF